MNNTKILEKAICKAEGYPYGCIVFPDIFIDKKYYSMIFSHDFAKAFWGDKRQRYCLLCREWNGVCSHYSDSYYQTTWQYHLQQMVLKEEPLKYLERFL